MPRIGSDHDHFSGGLDRSRSELQQLKCDPQSWGEPLSYVELMTDPGVQSRVAKLIVRSALKRPHRGR